MLIGGLRRIGRPLARLAFATLAIACKGNETVATSSASNDAGDGAAVTSSDDAGDGAAATSSASYGAGNFGSWVTDPNGLPAYDYAPGTDTTAEVFHQLGNGAVHGLAHADGYVELFTSRTFPRFANKYDDKSSCWAGAFGWIIDPQSTWSTLTPDAPSGATIKRRFGMGYFHRELAHDGIGVVQDTFAPNGDDEVLLEHITFTNTTSNAIAFSYVDYWGVGWRLTGGYESDHVITSFDATRQAILATSTRASGDLTTASATVDPSPKASFVSFLSTSVDHYDTVASAFVGSGTRALPAAVAAGHLTGSVDATGSLGEQAATLVTEKAFSIAPGASASLDVLYGLAPVARASTVIDQYRANYAGQLASVIQRWQKSIPTVSFPGLSWVEREMAWDYYYLASGTLLEDYFGKHVLNQGSLYLYGLGQNIAMRDPPQHVTPLAYVDPAVTRETLLYVAATATQAGKIPYGIQGYGALAGISSADTFVPSDMALWLIWATAEYVDATRDFAFLDHPVKTYDGVATTLYGVLESAFQYQVGTIGVGAHGLIKMLNSDWNDTLVTSSPDPGGTEADGESTMNTGLALTVYPRLLEIAQRRSDTTLATAVQAQMTALAPALKAQWRGKWFNRAYLGAGATLEIGATNLWMESNGPALSAPGVLTSAEAATLVDEVQSQVSDSSPDGMAAQGNPIMSIFANAGFTVTGYWYSITGLAIDGLTQWADRNPAAASLAWTEFEKSTLAHHATTYPDLWYGIWSGSDCYYSALHAPTQAGSTWMFAYPITNMHAHAQPLLASLRLAGVRSSVSGFTIDPVAPLPGEAGFTWKSPTFEVGYGPTSAFGTIQTVGGDTFTLKVKLPQGLPAAPSVRVGGASVPFTSAPPFVSFSVTGVAGGSVSWSVP